jgi:hypothetical protein
MDTLPYAVPAYSNTTLMIMGLLVSTAILASIIGVLYWLNTRIRRSMKESRDDWRVEQDIESGHTLHAEGIYGTRHSNEGGLHLRQEDPHPTVAGLKTGFKHNAHQETDDESFEGQKDRNVY